jgi:hypothetical protein
MPVIGGDVCWDATNGQISPGTNWDKLRFAGDPHAPPPGFGLSEKEETSHIEGCVRSLTSSARPVVVPPVPQRMVNPTDHGDEQHAR